MAILAKIAIIREIQAIFKGPSDSVYASYNNDHYMKRLLKDPENMFPSMNYDSGHPRPANRPNFDLSKIAKIRKNRDFFQKFDFL